MKILSKAQLDLIKAKRSAPKTELKNDAEKTKKKTI